MSSYIIEKKGDTLFVKFGDPAQNDQIVRDAVNRLKEMIVSGELSGGPIIKVNGPASLPVAMAICHAIAHLYQVVACYDPKLGKYVVAVTHSSNSSLGELVD